MAFDYVRPCRDQVFLLPVSMADWLEEGHLAWFVIDVVGALDTKALHARHPNDGAGRPAYDPDMMLALLLYAYANGMRSSRRIEAACRTDAGFRVISGGLVPDHATFARFVVDHEAAMQGLFVSGLRLCAVAGLVDLSTVAVDGTKMGANASLRANHGLEWVRAQVAACMAATVQSEEAEAGGACPDPMSAAEIRGVRARQRRLAQAQAQIEAEDAAAAEAMVTRDEAAAAEAEAGRRVRGRKPADPQAALARAEADYAATRARAEAKAQRRAAREAAATAAGRRLGGFAPGPDRRLAQAEQALAAAREVAAAAAPAPKRRANVTDADSRIMKTRQGFLQGYNAQAAVDANQIVLSQMVSQDGNDLALLEPMLELLERNLALGAVSGDIETVLADAGYWSDDNARLKLPGLLLIATQKDHKQRKAAREAGTTTGEPPEGASVLEAMEHRLRTAEGAAAYAKRSTTVEPVFGNHKANRNAPRFRRRGLAAVQAEWAFMNLGHNLGKLFERWTPGLFNPA
ncbi:MAG: transposase [Actinobacteria bacterium]|nr:transposase [Actinomycetota bacterium]